MATSGMSVGRLQRDPRAGWLAVALIALAGFVALVFLVTAWPVFGRADAALSGAIRATRTPVLTNAAGWMSEVGGLQFAGVVTFALIIWMAVRRNWAAIVYLFMTIVVGWLLGNDVVKNVIRRPRPVGVNLSPLGHDFSMPSSHSLASFLLLTTVCVIVMLNLPTGRHLKRWLAIASAVVIVLVGYSRVYLGVHWAGDVIGAWLLGGAWWSFTTATYFGSVTEEKRVSPRPGAPGASE